MAAGAEGDEDMHRLVDCNPGSFVYRYIVNSNNCRLLRAAGADQHVVDHRVGQVEDHFARLGVCRQHGFVLDDVGWPDKERDAGAARPDLETHPDPVPVAGEIELARIDRKRSGMAAGVWW